MGGIKRDPVGTSGLDLTKRHGCFQPISRFAFVRMSGYHAVRLSFLPSRDVTRLSSNYLLLRYCSSVMCSNEETQQMVKSLTPLETDPILLGSKYGWMHRGQTGGHWSSPRMLLIRTSVSICSALSRSSRFRRTDR